MTWLQTLPYVLAAALFLLLPGGLVTLSLGLRGLSAAALAGPVTISIAAVLAVLLPFASIPWSAAAVLAGGILLSALVVGIRFLGLRRVGADSSLRHVFLPAHRTGASCPRPRHAGAGAAPGLRRPSSRGRR